MKRFNKHKDLIKSWLVKMLLNPLTYEEQVARNILRLNNIKLDNKSIRTILRKLHHE